MTDEAPVPQEPYRSPREVGQQRTRPRWFAALAVLAFVLVASAASGFFLFSLKATEEISSFGNGRGPVPDEWRREQQERELSESIRQENLDSQSTGMDPAAAQFDTSLAP